MPAKTNPQSDDRKARLQTILRSKSLLHGDFILSSGEKSKIFFDVKMTSLDPEGAFLSADLILDLLEGEQITAVGGLAIGACPIVSAICVRSFERGRPIPSFYVRKEEKDHGTKKKVEGHALKAGDRVVVVDDVATKGGAMLDAIKAVRALGCEVVRAIVVVDREQGASAKLKEQGCTLEALFTRRDLEA